MKVRPVPKTPNNEIRIIRVNEAAIKELLWENLMENKNTWFNLSGRSEDYVFFMDWDSTNKHLSYIAVPLSRFSEVASFDFRKFRKYPTTTQTLFANRRYKLMQFRKFRP